MLPYINNPNNELEVISGYAISAYTADTRVIRQVVGKGSAGYFYIPYSPLTLSHSLPTRLVPEPQTIVDELFQYYSIDTPIYNDLLFALNGLDEFNSNKRVVVMTERTFTLLQTIKGITPDESNYKFQAKDITYNLIREDLINLAK